MASTFVDSDNSLLGDPAGYGWYQPSDSDNGKTSADDVIGNRFKILKPTIGHRGGINSTDLVTLPKGYLTGEVYSWVIDDRGHVWWMLGEPTKSTTPIFVKHEPGRFKIVPSAGGMFNQNLDEAASGSGSGIGLNDIDSILKKVLLIGGIGIGFYFLSPFFPAIRDGFEDLSDTISSHFNNE